MWEQQVGERICRLRKERNLTRAEFGELVGMSERYVGKIERGSTITIAAIANICNKIGVSADYLIFGSPDLMSTAAKLSELTREQVQITLDIAVNVIKFLSTETGNNALIQEVMRQKNSPESRHNIKYFFI